MESDRLTTHYKVQHKPESDRLTTGADDTDSRVRRQIRGYLSRQVVFHFYGSFTPSESECDVNFAFARMALEPI